MKQVMAALYFMGLVGAAAGSYYNDTTRFGMFDRVSFVILWPGIVVGVLAYDAMMRMPIKQ